MKHPSPSRASSAPLGARAKTRKTAGTKNAGRQVMLGNTRVGDGSPVFFIAEIGINHNGDVRIAKRLIDQAVAEGCNAVKFQKRTVPTVYSAEELARPREVPEVLMRRAIERKVLPRESVERLKKSKFKETTNGDLKWALELSEKEYRDIDAYCKKKGVLWFVSPWDEASVDFFDSFDLPCYKIASASLTDSALLRHIRSKGKPVILSTGMSSMEQIERAVRILGEKNLVLMHCVATYPTEDADVNLTMIDTLLRRFPKTVIGYSGHERGIAISIAAAVKGAAVIERHITLDRTMWGSDQPASLEPRGMDLMIRYVRSIETALGDGVKRVLAAEEPIRQKLRRKTDF